MTNKKPTERRIAIDLHFDRKRPEYKECLEILDKAFESLSASGKEELREVGYDPVSNVESASFVIASPKMLKNCTPQDKRLMPTILLLQDDEWNDDTADVLADPRWDVRGLFRLSKLGKNWDYEEFGGLVSAIKELARESMRQGGNAEESFSKPVDWKAKLTARHRVGFVSLFSDPSTRAMARQFKNALGDIRKRLPLAPNKRPPSLLLLGETGCGKSLLARAAADALFPGKEDHFKRLNISAYTNDLIDVELFGSKKGAFTGCDEDRPGVFVAGKDGVVFLDEIGDMEPRNQTRLLTYMDDGNVLPRGNTEKESAPCVVIAATNKRIDKGEGDFREDLFCRFDHVVTIPPLRERKRDLRLLVSLTLQDEEVNPERKVGFISFDAIEYMERRNFPGNFRELRFLLRQSVRRAAASGSECLCLRHLAG